MKNSGFLFIILLILLNSTGFSQVTTSGMNGLVAGINNEFLPNASVTAIHQPTGTRYITTADLKGYYRLPNIVVGGPYSLKISFVGYETYTKENIYLTLGQTATFNVALKERAAVLEGIEIKAEKYSIFDGNRTGAETYIGKNEIVTLPTIDRSLNDLIRLTPQAIVVGGGVAIAGVNNRYNSIFVDGAVNNDVFGLASSGTNGGQLGITPFSTDAIDEFQVAVAPYDVKLSGFAGAGINAVTRRGTNEIKGSAYYFMRNENLSGKKPAKTDSLRKKADAFSAITYGLSLGGPIIKDKLFFFLNAEQQRDQTPRSFNLNDYTGNIRNNPDSLLLLKEKLSSYGYNPGTYVNPEQTTNSDKFLLRLDYTINKDHHLTLRHSYTKGVSIYPYEVSNSTQLVYNANWINFKSVTNSSALELNSIFGKHLSNNFILGYTTTRDDRDPNGTNFPYVKIKDGPGKYIILGSERYSSANDLQQKIFTLTDNFDVFLGKHTLTFGTHNEFYKMYNLFIRENFGRYNYNNVSQFIQGLPRATYSHSYSLVDDITGDGSKAAADFKAMQLGFYVQDEWKYNNKLTMTGGIRIDVPIFRDNPIEIPLFDTTLTKMKEAGYDIKGAQSGKMPVSQLMLSPRIGFNYDLAGNKKTQIRGGVGIFTSRIPFVWPGGAYTNSGMIIGGLSITKDTVAFNPDPNTQYTAESVGLSTKKPSGDINLFTKNFKYPQVIRGSVGIDQKLPWWGLIGGAEFILTKTLNNIILYNLNIQPSTRHLTGSPDDRPIYGSGGSPSLIESRYTGVYLIDNTSKGYSYNITLQLQKPSEKGFSGSIACTVGHAKGLVDGTSSQNSSQWRYTPNVRGRNKLDQAYTNFDMGMRLVTFLSYKLKYAGHFATTLSVFYNGQSGSRYSYIYLDGYKMTSEDAVNDQDLIWIPKDQSEINLVDYTNGSTTITAAEQWTLLDDMINKDKYLSSHRGEYAQRNGARLPFEHNIDLKLVQDFYLGIKGHQHTLQLSLDIFNVANLINPEWGWKYYTNMGVVPLIKFEGFEADGTTPKFTYRNAADFDVKNVNDAGIGTSRWYGQVGVRYIF